MEPITTTAIATALGYILKASSESKAVGTAKEELLEGFWNWIRPLFLKDDPQLEKQLEEKPDETETQQKVLDKLMALLQDPAVAAMLQAKVAQLQQAKIRKKNVTGKLKNIKGRVRIGDKVINPNESFDEKNTTGDLSDITGEIVIGDG